MKKFSLLFVFTLGSMNVFAMEGLPSVIENNSPLLVPMSIPKCVDANFQYKTCIDEDGMEIPNPKFIEYSNNNPERRGIKRSPHIILK